MPHLIRCGKLSSVEVTQSCLARLDAINPKVNAITLALHEEALAQAREADARLRKGEHVGPLHGVPVTTKINTDQQGYPTDGGIVLA